MNNSPTGFRPAGTLSMIAIIGLAIMAAFELLKVVFGVIGILDPSRPISLQPGETQSLWMLIQGLIAFFQIPVFIATIVFFLIWLYRANTNLDSLQTSHQEFSAGWAVGWWFIPFANLVKPFQAVREVWFDSDPVIETEPVFLSANLKSAPTFMVLWWAFWIAGNVVSNVTGRIYDIRNLQSASITGFLFVLSGGLTCIAAVLCIKIVREVTTRQEQRFANLMNMHRYSPPPPPNFG